MWSAADEAGAFGALIKMLLLTAQRLAKVREMRWSDIDDSGVWTIATQPREKGNAGALQLPPAALAVLSAQPRYASSDYVFTGQGDKPLTIGLGNPSSTKPARYPAGRCTICGAPHAV